MPKGFAWGEATRSEVARLYREGREVSAIARELGLVEDSIRGYLQRAGLWERPGPIRDPASPRGSEVVRRFRGGESVAAIAAGLGVGQTIVRRCLKAAGEKMASHPALDFTPEDRARIAERYASGETAQSLAAEYGTSPGTVGRCVRAAGGHWRTGGEERFRLPIDESVFDVVTPESAYWAGFLLADGNVSDHPGRQRIIQLTLSERDAGHVAKFRDFLKSGRTIIRRAPSGYAGSRGSAMFAVASDRLATSLARFGVVPRKSADARVIGLESDRDFWRGCIDGDGSLFARKGGAPILGLVGSRPLMGQFREFVRSHSPGYAAEVHPHKSIWSVVTSTRHAQRMIEVLYGGATVYLDRKMEVARWFQESPYRMPEGLLGRSLRREARREGDELPLFKHINQDKT